MGYATGVAHAGQIKFPCVGEINADHVNLRAGRSLNYEIVAQVDKGERVTVCGFHSGWFRIIPPGNVSFWVSNRYISGGKVTPGRLNVRVQPSTNSTVVCQLERGAGVEEIEARGDWTSIEPPRDACLWVSSELVDLLPGEKGRQKPERLVAAGGDVTTEETPVASAPAQVANPIIEGQPAPPAGGVKTTKIPRVYKGKIVRVEEVAVPGANHSLVTGFFRKRVLCLLKSRAINLSYYEGDRVKIWGYDIGRSSKGTPILDVRRLEVE